ncbi:MAG: hypothetical protein UY63_C0019G0005 [Parcubacteria group bacterium GW2011_GWA2_51_10]|nr:MAG: hypothetical protein UY63_C0019G0005 [Parcubacteria group bacterium GW2011_GWA2_51_10]
MSVKKIFAVTVGAVAVSGALIAAGMVKERDFPWDYVSTEVNLPTIEKFEMECAPPARFKRSGCLAKQGEKVATADYAKRLWGAQAVLGTGEKIALAKLIAEGGRIIFPGDPEHSRLALMIVMEPTNQP